MFCVSSFSQGYEIHVTKSVKPEPVQMKDILTCSGASFLPKMPSSDKVPVEHQAFLWHTMTLHYSPHLICLRCVITSSFMSSLPASHCRDFMRGGLAPVRSGSLRIRAGRHRWVHSHGDPAAETRLPNTLSLCSGKRSAACWSQRKGQEEDIAMPGDNGNSHARGFSFKWETQVWRPEECIFHLQGKLAVYHHGDKHTDVILLGSVIPPPHTHFARDCSFSCQSCALYSWQNVFKAAKMGLLLHRLGNNDHHNRACPPSHGPLCSIPLIVWQ